MIALEIILCASWLAKCVTPTRAELLDCPTVWVGTEGEEGALVVDRMLDMIDLASSSAVVSTEVPEGGD